MIKGRFKSFDFWDGTIFGVFCSAIMMCASVIIFREILGIDSQTIATLVAIPVAIASLFYSTGYQSNINKNNIERELASARTVLPLAVSELYRVAQSGIQISAGLHPNRSMNHGEIMELLRVSPESLSTLRDCVKLSDSVTRDWISIVIARYQVYYSRSEELSRLPISYEAGEIPVPGWSRLNITMDWCTLKCLIEHLFPYARSTQDQVKDRVNCRRIREIFHFELLSVTRDVEFDNFLSRTVARYEPGSVENFRLSGD